MRTSNLAALLFGFTAYTLSEFVALDFNILRGDLDKRDRNQDHPQLVQRGVKRDGLALMTLSNKKTFYVATLKFGSNKDEVEVDIDTGSSDLWVMDDNVSCAVTSSKRDGISNEFDSTEILPRDNSLCTAYGSFNPTNSKSYKNNNTRFYISYADGSASLGTWGTDTVAFGSASIPDFIFAVVNSSSTNTGILGIGLSSNEASYKGNLGGIKYENFPLRLKSEGIINKAVFSVYLSDQDTGSVLFGAVDNAKYSGTLTTVPIVNADTDLEQYGFNASVLYTIMVQNMFLSDNGKKITVSGTPQAALLDTGATISHFPSDVLADLVSLVGGEYSYDYGAYVIPCYSSSNTTKFNINFSGTTVQIPISALVRPLKNSLQCYLGVAKQPAGKPLSFGDNILRSLYVVFDLDAQELSVAQAKYSNDTDIQVISSTIPGAVKAQLYSATSFSMKPKSTGIYSGTLTRRSSRGGGAKTETGFMFFLTLLAGIVIA